jgi:hypothetical protein
MDAGAAVDVRRKFLGEERCTHACSPDGRVRIGLRRRPRQAAGAPISLLRAERRA